MLKQDLDDIVWERSLGKFEALERHVVVRCGALEHLARCRLLSPLEPR
ncbi:MAG TPA: hypothetical protein VGQ84_05135 [Gaiellaceae bacterium]|nr:hypothetical protein [Gaiellaceae bacterium]